MHVIDALQKKEIKKRKPRRTKTFNEIQKLKKLVTTRFEFYNLLQEELNIKLEEIKWLTKDSEKTKTKIVTIIDELIELQGLMNYEELLELKKLEKKFINEIQK